VKAFVYFSIALFVGCGPRVEQPACPPNPQAQLPLPPFRGMVYSEDFARKFEAPAAGIRALDPGLQAVVVRVVQAAGEYPECLLDLYLDDSLDLAFPAGDEGIMTRPEAENPIFFVRSEKVLGVESTRWSAMLGSFHAVRCRTGHENCAVTEQGGPIAYARHLIPGLALQTYRLMCSAFDPTNGPVEMWIQRRGHEADTVDVTKADLDRDGNFRFAIPADLLEHAAPRTREAMKAFSQVLKPEPPRGLYTVPPAGKK
jgi:hypothetical protein